MCTTADPHLQGRWASWCPSGCWTPNHADEKTCGSTPRVPSCPRTRVLPKKPWKVIMCARPHPDVQFRYSHSLRSAEDQDCKVLTRVWEVSVATA